MLAIDLPHARRLAYGVVLGQAAVTVLLAGCALGLSGQRAAVSAVLGGGIATAGSLVMASLGMAGAAGARRALGAFYAAEAAKLALVAALFVTVLKTVRVVPLAMFAAFAGTWLVYWIALLIALPAPGGVRSGQSVGE